MAIVGAGIAGLACARALEAAGADVTVFDKGRGVGGRIATRRLDGMSFDHGAQFATARGSSFRAFLDSAREAGAAAPWPAASDDRDIRWVGVPGMSALPRHLAAGLVRPPQLGRHVAWIARDGASWSLRHLPAADIAPGTTRDAGELAGPFDALVVAIPAPQAAALLGLACPDLAASARAVVYAPSWTVMAAFAERVDLPDVVRSKNGPVAWMAREASRPGRAATPERWVVQASADASRTLLEQPPDAVIATLLDGVPGTPSFASAHRWRHSQVERAVGAPCLWDPGLRLGACGDWCVGGRVEGAFDSGEALARLV